MMSKTPGKKTKKETPSRQDGQVGSKARSASIPSPESEIQAWQDSAGNQAVNQALNDGQPLDQDTRLEMESHFGRDLSDVRVHTGAEGGERTVPLDAEAVTFGSHVYLAGDGYRPQTTEGRMMLAHELAHVVQGDQNSHRSPSTEASLEAEASAASMQVMAGQPAPVSLQAPSSTPMALTREDRLRRGKIGSLIGLGVAAAGLTVATLLGATLGVGTILAVLGGGLVLGGLIGYMAKRTEKVTPKEADQLIRGRFGDNLMRAIVESISAAKSNLNVVDDKKFRAAYAAAGLSPDTYDTCGGFVDRSTKPPTVWIHKDRQKTVTILHEALHVYSHKALRTDPGITSSITTRNYVNEGFTQYFTKQIADEQYISLEGIGEDYRSSAREVAALADLAGEDTLRHAYFEGDIAGLRATVDAVHGAGTFDSWAAAMNAKDWTGARRIIKGRK